MALFQVLRSGRLCDGTALHFPHKGKHEITVVSRREPMILHSIYLQNEESLFDYKTVYEQQKKDGVSDTSGQSIEIQAEYATKKSSRMLYPVQDQSSPAITPYSAKELKITPSAAIAGD